MFTSIVDIIARHALKITVPVAVLVVVVVNLSARTSLPEDPLERAVCLIIVALS
jgi:hypothetical protein